MFWHLLLQDTRDDVGGAQNTGMLGILVKTGTFPLYLILHLFIKLFSVNRFYNYDTRL